MARHEGTREPSQPCSVQVLGITDILKIFLVDIDIDSILRYPGTWCAAPAAGGPADTCSAR